ncbi:hypothetical protein SLEP1_g10065 [Rubroshorea leprosula]|uniref:Glycosyl transferase CAP10 domain-containing protein n=1 Tax=Rubroshorea leprosula TaxID=152421 RepID=A0AAV5IG70_9ROSI|nr:hypothetical protein SLEP1_g10065 [Rubroshorea leprosula]
MNQSSLWQWRPTSRNTAVTTVIFFLLLFVGLSVFMGWFDVSIFYSGFSLQQQILSNHRIEHPLKCGNQTEITCPMSNYPNTTYNVTNPVNSSGTMCPSYFRWIHEDLRPWKETGITKDMVELARKTASFRLVIVNGTAYLQKYMWVFETRDKFSWWGIVQLLRWYPGRLPDLDMMFECGDLPLIPSRNFQGPDARPPPLFRYCSNEESLDIVFPDWSFWGWEFMEESLVTSPSNSIPCTLPPPYNATEMREFLDSKANATRKVEMLEKEYWDHIKKKQ